MAKEQKAQKENPAAAVAPGATVDYALTLFKPVAGLSERLAKATRLNLPRMVLPASFPIFTEENQAVLVGTIVKGTNSPASTVKGKCIWLRLENGEEVLLPCTGSIRQAIAPDCAADSKDLVAAIDKLAGKTYAFKRLPNTQNKKYNREQFIFDIFKLD